MFYDNISQQCTKPSILSLVPKYSGNYVSKSIQPYFPHPLTTLHNEKCLKLNYHKLLQVCKDVSIDISSEISNVIENETRSQSKSKLWYKYQAGRVTTSWMRAVCLANSSDPSQSISLYQQDNRWRL